MKKLYYLFIIALLFSSNLAFGQKAGEFSKDMKPRINGSFGDEQEYYLPLPPFLVGDDSLVSVTLYGYVYDEDELIIYSGKPFDSTNLLLEKDLKANEQFEFSIPANRIIPFLNLFNENSSEVPTTQVIKNKGLYLRFNHYITNILIKISTKYNAYYSNIFNPSHALGRSYKITSYKNPGIKNNSNSFPFVNIYGILDKTKISFYIGGDSNTILKLKNGKEFKSWEIMHDTLNRGDCLLLTGFGENTDLGGCMVLANKPFAINSGNTYSSIGDNDSLPGFLLSNEVPAIAYENKYYIPPLRNNGHSPILRIFAKDSSNVFAGDSLIGKIKYQFGMKDSAWIEYKIEENKPITIWGDRDINVVSYSTGIIDNKNNHPIQMNITPSEQYYNSTALFVPNLGIMNQKDYATFIVQSDTSGNFPKDIKISVTSKDGKKESKSLNDFTIINKQEIYDPALKNSKNKVFTFSLRLTKENFYSIYCHEQFRIYANGYNDEFNYLYNSESTLMDLERPDTLCPEPHYRLTGSGICYRAETYVVDRPRDDAEVRSNMGIIYFNQKESYNFEFSNDDFIPGETDSIGWYVNILDFHYDARAVITFTDRAGNDTTLIIDYKARKMDLSQSDFNFGYVPVGQSQTQKFTMTNNADFDFLFRTISFGSYPYLHERKGFKLNFLFDTTKFILPTQTVEFEVTFAPTELGIFRDTLYLSDTTCYSDMKLVVAGNSDGTSVKESEEGISIIPNPASDYITVDVTFLRMQESEIKIYNIFGECVLSTPSSLRDATPQEGNFKIDISSLPAGVYFVKRGNDKPMKFVIVR